MVRGAGERMLDQLELVIVGAWRGAAFNAAASVGKLPDLDKVLMKRKQPTGGIDVAYTTAEARRWAEIEKAKAVDLWLTK